MADWSIKLITESPQQYLSPNESYTFFVRISGGKYLIVNDQMIHLQPYQLLIIAPNSCCSLVESDEDAPHEWLYMRIHPIVMEHVQLGSGTLLDLVNQHLSITLRQTFLPPLEYLHLKYITATVEKIQQSPSSLDQLEAFSYTSVVLCHICRNISQENSFLLTDVADPLMQAAHQHIRNNFTGDCSLDTLAAHFGVSKYHLSHRFTQTYGLTIYQFVLRCRIEHAQMLICQHEPMSNLAARCGFNDYSAFVRTFTSIIGMSPAKWRNQQLGRK